MELEKDHIEATKFSEEALVAESSKVGPLSSRQKKSHHNSKMNKRKWFENQDAGGKHKFYKLKKDKKKIKCFNSNKKSHFAHECTKPKKVSPSPLNSNLFVSSCLFFTKFNPMWIVNSRATNHITKDCETYVEFRRVSSGTRWIYVGNNSKAKVHDIDTCKLKFHGGHTLLLYDVLFTPDIRRNLVSTIILLKLGFSLNFHGSSLPIYSDTIFYVSCFVSDNFINLDTEYSFSIEDSCFF